MRTRVKVCGLTRAADVAASVTAGADALGWVLVPSSPRHVPLTAAVNLARPVPPFISRVALFVDPRPVDVEAALATGAFDTLQFHGDESPEFCGRFFHHARVVKAFRVRGPETLNRLESYRGVTHGWLLDAHVPGIQGGTGTRFDWDLAVGAVGKGHPVILAGGLTPENAAEAVEQVRPHAVDVSSGVEARPGEKDTARVRAFLRAVRAVDGS